MNLSQSHIAHHHTIIESIRHLMANRYALPLLCCLAAMLAVVCLENLFTRTTGLRVPFSLFLAVLLVIALLR